MKARDVRDAFELSIVALCLWAALYYTPMGALVRSIGGWFMGSKRSAPILSYYTGGTVGAQSTRFVISGAPPPTALTPDDALGWGAFAAYKQASDATKETVRASLRELNAGGDTDSPEAMTRALQKLKARGMNENAAMLQIFAGDAAARFAEKRARGEGRGLDLEDLARQLPPGYESGVEQASLAAMLSVGYNLRWPGPRDARVTSPFGWRTHPVSGEKKFHKGIDLGIPTGTEILAAADGVVVRSSLDDYNGNIVVIAHGNNARTLYLHNSERLATVGAKVRAGELIARSGATGIATGPHLHYQLELGGEPYDPLVFAARAEEIPAAVPVKETKPATRKTKK